MDGDNASIFSLTQQQVDELNEMMYEIMEKCLHLKTPMFITVAISNSEEETKYLRQMVSAHHLKLQLYDNQVNEHMKIANGFKAVPGRECFVVDAADLFGAEENDDE